MALRVLGAAADVGLQVAEVERAQKTVLDKFADDDFRLILTYDLLPGMVGEVSPGGLETPLAQPDVETVVRHHLQPEQALRNYDAGQLVSTPVTLSDGQVE